MNFHQNLQDITEDQLSLASIHYMRSHYQEAIDIYKRILLDNRLVQLVSICLIDNLEGKAETNNLIGLFDLAVF